MDDLDEDMIENISINVEDIDSENSSDLWYIFKLIDYFHRYIP
jgi:hypothetical protein